MKKLKNAKITILFSEDGLNITLIDGQSGISFADVMLNAEQTMQAFSRIARTECDIDVYGLHKVGKTMEMQDHVFEIDKLNYADRKNHAIERALETCPEGWEPDNGFNSQGSFFEKDGKQYARTTIRRWI